MQTRNHIQVGTSSMATEKDIIGLKLSPSDNLGCRKDQDLKESNTQPFFYLLQIVLFKSRQNSGDRKARSEHDK